ncbi:MAG: glycogen/starch synthase, partial [Bacteroidales bacterium]|nr:glycogen/starch synthase [Bacteroidales bacterium]
MRVLMFGWEFPPHITGGLGTACFGMTKGLAKNDVDVLFVVPRAYGDEDETNVRLLNASEVTIDIDHEKDRSYWERVQYMEIGSNIIPYVGPEEFANVLEYDRHVVENFNRSGSVFARNYQFSGKYGMNLMEE